MLAGAGLGNGDGHLMGTVRPAQARERRRGQGQQGKAQQGPAGSSALTRSHGREPKPGS
jgi:hypothetical protein